MLRNTLILPDNDARLAAELVREAIDTLDVILMFVFGKDDHAKQIVDWADQLADRTNFSESVSVRHVVWVRFADRESVPATLRTELDTVFGGGEYPLVGVLNFHDQLKGSLSNTDDVDPIALEKLFLKGMGV